MSDPVDLTAYPLRTKRIPFKPLKLTFFNDTGQDLKADDVPRAGMFALDEHYAAEHGINALCIRGLRLALSYGKGEAESPAEIEVDYRDVPTDVLPMPID